MLGHADPEEGDSGGPGTWGSWCDWMAGREALVREQAGGWLLHHLGGLERPGIHLWELKPPGLCRWKVLGLSLVYAAFRSLSYL